MPTNRDMAEAGIARHLGRAESVSVQTDEDGFELHFTTEAGPFVVNVHPVLGQLLEEVTENLLRYLDEGDKARASRPVTDDRAAYDPGDPKSWDWHSKRADLYDSRSGK